MNKVPRSFESLQTLLHFEKQDYSFESSIVSVCLTIIPLVWCNNLKCIPMCGGKLWEKVHLCGHLFK